MEEKRLKILEAPDTGRGVYSDCEIKAGEFVCECELLVLSETDTALLSRTDLKYYTYAFTNLQDCLALGVGSLFNHSEDPNIKFELSKHNASGRPVLIFIALKDIKPGEQLCIDYRADCDVNIGNYKVNLY